MRAIFATKDGNVALSETGKFLEKLAKRYGHNRSVGPASRLETKALLDFNVLRNTPILEQGSSTRNIRTCGSRRAW